MSDSKDLIDTLLTNTLEGPPGLGRKGGGFGRKGAAEAAAEAERQAQRQAEARARDREHVDDALAFLLDGDDAAAPGLSEDQGRVLVSAMIAAAKADGVFDDDERAAVFQRFDTLDADDVTFLRAEIDKPIDVHALAARVDGPQLAKSVYAASCLMADGETAHEKRYLDDLAQVLALSDDVQQTIAQQVARIRATAAPLPDAGGSINAWYFCDDAGNREGPMHFQLAARYARLNPDALCWREGFDDWRAVRDAPELDLAHVQVFRYTGKDALADDVDFKIVGNDLQFVEIELDEGESAIGEPGAMMYKDSAVAIDAVFGDGTGQDSSIVKKMLGAGKRVLSGEDLFLSFFTNRGRAPARVAFASSFPGTIVPLKLDHFGGRIICQKDAFLAAAKGVSIGVHARLKVMFWVFGGEGMILQSLEGDGWSFLHAGGTVTEIDLAPGETLDVDTGSLVAFTDTVDYDVQLTGGVKSILFSGEGISLIHLKGPGRVWLQSLPFSRLAGHLFGLWEQRQRQNKA